MLQEQEAPVEKVYFPLSGVISLISVMKDDRVVETALVGREGAVGAFGGLGPWNAFTRAVVQLPGMAIVIPVSRFQAAVAQSERFRNLILRYKVCCTCPRSAFAMRTSPGRASRPGLLQALDRTGDPELPLTQEFIAQMLAVRRTTVTVIASKLQEAGIRYHRGHIAVLDRPRLEESACECYSAIRRRTEAVFTPQFERI